MKLAIVIATLGVSMTVGFSQRITDQAAEPGPLWD